MSSNQKIEYLGQLREKLEILRNDSDFLLRVENSNPWFISDYTIKAIDSICQELLDPLKLEAWMSRYTFPENPHSIGVIAAGNIPLVSFHDILCVYASPYRLHLKVSSKDQFIATQLIDIWTAIDAEWKDRLTLVDRIEGCDKIIATGSNNTFKYFEHYFSKYASILRKNRTSIAIIKKDTSDRDLDELMDDIFSYFGLGCRNVSKIWIESGFDTDRIFEASERYNYLFSHSKYMNNYDYQRTLLLLNKVPHLSNDFFILKEDSQLFSPLSVVHYQKYDSVDEITPELITKAEDIQCVIGGDHIPFGQSQCPSLFDYADGIDVMHFLSD